MTEGIPIKPFVLKQRNLCITREVGSSSPMTIYKNVEKFILTTEWWVKVKGSQSLIGLEDTF